MKAKDLSLFSLSKILAIEILIEEQLEQLITVRVRFFKRYLSSKESLKRKFILSKIYGAFIFGILPIIPLLTYFEVLDFINEGIVPIEFILFSGSVLFGIFFLFQILNFFLMAMLNTMKILTGNVFEWFETLPISREKLKKVMFLTIIRSLDIPLIVITISLPVIMLIGTQNLFIFLICIGVSILTTIFSFSLLILFSERLNRVLNIYAIGSKRTYMIRIINLITYIIIVIGSIFLIQWALNSIDVFFVLFARSNSPPLLILILSMIPFPIAPGYLISSFFAPLQIPIHIWYNIIIGFTLFLLLTWLLYLKSIKGIKRITQSKFKKEKSSIAQSLNNMKKSIKIKRSSHVWAFIRKDIIISSHELKNFLSLVMPILIGFIFTFTYYITNLGGHTPFEIDFIYNLLVIVGFNLIISGMIVYGLLNIEEPGSAILAGLPLEIRYQARAKLILMCSIQTFAVLGPSLMYIGRSVFINSIFTALWALPMVLFLLIIMFELRIYFFGKWKHFYLIEEVLPEKKVRKWLLIYAIMYFIYFLIFSYIYPFYIISGTVFILFFYTFSLLTGFILLSLIFTKIFPLSKAEIQFKKNKKLIRKKKKKIKKRIRINKIEIISKSFIKYAWISILIFFILNSLIIFISSFFPPSYLIQYLFIYNIFYIILWIVINPLFLGIPTGYLSFTQYLKKVTLGENEISQSILIIAIVLFFDYYLYLNLFSFSLSYSSVMYYFYMLIIYFSYYFWQEFAFKNVILTLTLNKVKFWKDALILNAFLFSISQFFYLFLTNSFINIHSFALLTEFLFIFLSGLFVGYLYIKTENLIIVSLISSILNTRIRFLTINLTFMSVIHYIFFYIIICLLIFIILTFWWHKGSN